MVIPQKQTGFDTLHVFFVIDVRRAPRQSTACPRGMWNIGAAFWGLLAGFGTSLLLERTDFKEMLEERQADIGQMKAQVSTEVKAQHASNWARASSIDKNPFAFNHSPVEALADVLLRASLTAKVEKWLPIAVNKILYAFRRYRKLHQVQVHRLRGSVSCGLLS